MIILCVDAGSGPPVPPLLQTRCARHAGRPGRGGVPWARSAYADASRQGPRATAPPSPAVRSPPCTSRRWQFPAACRADPSRPDLFTRRTHHQPVIPFGGSHGQYSGFPAVVPTRNIADPKQSNIHYTLRPLTRGGARLPEHANRWENLVCVEKCCRRVGHSTLKNEMCHHRALTQRIAAGTAVMENVETWYNRRMTHMNNG